MQTRRIAGEYTADELRLTIQQERHKLTVERVDKVNHIRNAQTRIDQIDARLVELDKAENILEGEL